MNRRTLDYAMEKLLYSCDVQIDMDWIDAINKKWNWFNWYLQWCMKTWLHNIHMCVTFQSQWHAGCSWCFKLCNVLHMIMTKQMMPTVHFEWMGKTNKSWLHECLLHEALLISWTPSWISSCPSCLEIERGPMFAHQVSCLDPCLEHQLSFGVSWCSSSLSLALGSSISQCCTNKMVCWFGCSCGKTLVSGAIHLLQFIIVQ